MVRTRFAPSPTGYMHIGNLRTALYTFSFARHNQGIFILRIEDTDRKRNVPKAIQIIYDSLKLAGIDYDEGPDVDGGYGPYIQSQRMEQGIYQRQAQALVERGAAYCCFCEKASGEAAPASPPPSLARSRRDPCRYLSAAGIQARLQDGKPYVVRQRIPDSGATTFHDLIFGDITVNNNLLDDQVLLKSDGFPTYNFANVVDDHLMAITHVLRGVEYLSSAPKYNLLYQGFGWQIPEYVHLPHIVRDDGKKLSKRAGDASFQDLLAKGFLPSAIINYIALLGWSPGNDRELFSLEEIIQEFDIRRINKSKAAFSVQKLEWINGEHIRGLTVERFKTLARSFYPPEMAAKCDIDLISQVIQTRLAKLADIPEMTRFLLEMPQYELSLYDHDKSKSSQASSLRVLQETLPSLTALSAWNMETIRQVLMDYAAQSGQKTGTVMWPLRVALSGLQSTPGGALEIAAILGKPESLRRLQAAVSAFVVSPSVVPLSNHSNS
jgi:glutamyl-tRNA synthetase